MAICELLEAELRAEPTVLRLSYGELVELNRVLRASELPFSIILKMSSLNWLPGSDESFFVTAVLSPSTANRSNGKARLDSYLMSKSYRVSSGDPNCDLFWKLTI